MSKASTKLAGRQFTPGEMVITSQLPDSMGNWKLNWDLSVRGLTQDDDFLHGYDFKASAYFHLLEIKSWRDFEGKSVTWDSLNQGFEGTLYVFEHAEIPRSKITFGQIEDGKIEFEWEGEGHLFFDKSDSNLWKDVPFHLKGSANFEPTMIYLKDGTDFDSLSDRVSEIMNLDDYIVSEKIADERPNHTFHYCHLIPDHSIEKAS